MKRGLSGRHAPPAKAAFALSPNWLGLLTVGFVFVTLVALLWRRSGSVAFDFGAQLYLPWALNQGAVLHRDIAYNFGPASQNFNALLFSLFGDSLTTLLVTNAGLLLLLSATIYFVFVRIWDHATATVAGITFLCCFGATAQLSFGNYNYLTPYTHEATHGAILNVLLVPCLVAAHTRQSLGLWILAGVMTGLTLLLKAEALMTAVATAATAAFVGFLTSKTIRQLRFTAGMAGGMLLPVAGMQLLLTSRSSWQDALRSVSSNVRFSSALDLTVDDHFYRWVMGIDDIPGNLASLVTSSLVLVGLVAIGLLIARQVHVREQNSWLTAIGFELSIAGAVAGVILVAVELSLVPGQWLLDPCRSAPLVALIGFVVAIRGVTKTQPPHQVRWLLLLLWSVMAGTSLAKVVLNARIAHYGFVQTMPAALLIVGLLAGEIPARIQDRAQPRRDRDPRAAVFRAIMIGCVGAVAIQCVRTTYKEVSARGFVVGEGQDRMLAFGPESQVHEPKQLWALKTFLEQERQAGDTVAIFPEGAIVNYWLRSLNPTPYHVLMPWDYRAYGGVDEVDNAILRAAPTYIVVINRDTIEFGVRYFGVEPDYGGKLLARIEHEYELCWSQRIRPDIDYYAIRAFKRRPKQDQDATEP